MPEFVLNAHTWGRPPRRGTASRTRSRTLTRQGSGRRFGSMGARSLSFSVRPAGARVECGILRRCAPQDHRYESVILNEAKDPGLDARQDSNAPYSLLQAIHDEKVRGNARVAINNLRGVARDVDPFDPQDAGGICRHNLLPMGSFTRRDIETINLGG